MTTIKNGHRRIAYCECGAQLAGNSEEELFQAAQLHIAHHHPQLLGALGQDLVQQMAEDVGG
jgi:predicted small metal-binding protein